MLPITPRVTNEHIDKFPYLEITVAKEVDLTPNVEGEEKMTFKNPVYSGQIENFSSEEESTINLIDAVEKGYIRILGYDHETGELKYEMLPLPRDFFEDQLLHMSSTKNESRLNDFVNGFQQLLKSRKSGYTFLQTTESEVEGSYPGLESLAPNDREQYVRLYFNTDALMEVRDVYLDQECIWVTPEEYPKAFVVRGGVPRSCLERAELIQVEVKKQKTYKPWDTITREDFEKQLEFRKAFLLDYLEKYLPVEEKQ